MKLAIFGATGGTGRLVAEKALAQGYEVSALVRDPGRLALVHDRLTVVTGNVLDTVAVEQTLNGAGAAIISLGNTSNNPDYIVSEGTRVILAAMKKLAVPRVVVVSSIGVGDSKDQVPFFFKMLMKSALKRPMEDKERQEAAVMASGLDWIIVRPGGLTDNPATGSYKAGLDKTIVAGQVSRADVADFVLQQVTDDTYLRKTPAIS
jgi:uncharacterized protein YbjT (DUF2867 family)